MTKLTQTQLEQALKNGAYEKYEGAVIEYLEDGERTGIKAWADLYEVLGKPVLAEPHNGEGHYYNRSWNNDKDDNFIVIDGGYSSKINPILNVWGHIEHPYKGRLGFNVFQLLTLEQFSEKTLIDAIEDDLGYIFSGTSKSPRYEIMKAFKTVTIDGQKDGESVLNAINRQLYAPSL